MSPPSTTTDTSTHRSVFMSCVDKHVLAPRSYYIIGLSATSCSPGLVVIGSFSVPPSSTQCFTCSTCRNRLVPGDRFHYINGSLFCEHDRPTALINGHLSSLQTNPLLPDQKVRPPTLSSLGTGETWRGLSDGGERSVVLCGLISEYLKGQKTDNFKVKYKSLKGSSSVSWSH